MQIVECSATLYHNLWPSNSTHMCAAGENRTPDPTLMKRLLYH